MSKKLFKTIFTPAVMVLISIFSLFSASATTDEVCTIAIDKRMSTEDEHITEESTEPEATVPTIKPSYITSPGVFYVDEDPTEAVTVETTAPTDDVYIPTSATGATSAVSSDDNLATPEEATMDTASKGVVNTSDSSMSVLILVGLTAMCCVVIGMHKKNLAE